MPKIKTNETCENIFLCKLKPKTIAQTTAANAILAISLLSSPIAVNAS